MIWGSMKTSKLLTMCLLVIISTQAWGSRVYWLKTYGPGSLSFWQNKNLPNTTNLCRNGVGMGSKLYWESCTYDQDNPTVLLPGTKAHWEKGYGPGTKNYWNSALTQTAGLTSSNLCTAPNGYRPGMRLYYKHCTGPGSLAYWNSGTGLGSRIYWQNGDKRSVTADWVGPCMATTLEAAWCEQMRKDESLQDSSILDWSASGPGPQENHMSCSNLSSDMPSYQQSLGTLLSTAANITLHELNQLRAQ
jgi:hypothetical protein